VLCVTGGEILEALAENVPIILTGMGSSRTVLDLEDKKSWPQGIYLFYSVLYSQSLCGSLELCRARDSRV